MSRRIVLNKEMDICGMGTGASLSFLEGSDTNNSIFKLILSNNLSYNLCLFVWKSVYLEKKISYQR